MWHSLKLTRFASVLLWIIHWLELYTFGHSKNAPWACNIIFIIQPTTPKSHEWWVGVWEWWECCWWSIFFLLAASEVFEDPFSSHQEESQESFSHNSIESVLQRKRELGFPPRNHQEEVFSRSARSFITEEILEALRKADRKGRDVVVGLSNACCKWGCSKSEISSLCWGPFRLERRRRVNMHTQTSFSGSGVIFLCLSVTL